MDRAKLEALETLMDRLAHVRSQAEWENTVTALLHELPALLRLARAVADAPRVEMVQSWADKGGVYAELHTSDIITALGDLTDGTRVLLLRADAADTTAGDAEPEGGDE